MTGNQNLGENWYIVLDLYPDKREEGLEVNLNRKIIEEIIQKQIMERLNQKALEWSKSTDNNTKKYLSLKNKIEEDMRNSQKRKEFSKDLKKRLKVFIKINIFCKMSKLSKKNLQQINFLVILYKYFFKIKLWKI